MTGSLKMRSEYHLASEEETLLLANKLALVLTYPFRIYFQGEIGTGKTFLIRALLKALGVPGRIKSPTYSLIENYSVKKLSICHVDLYRVNHEDELDYIGFNEAYETSDLCLIEWPEKSPSLLEADVLIQLAVFDQGHRAVIQSNTEKGANVLASLTQHDAKQCR